MNNNLLSCRVCDAALDAAALTTGRARCGACDAPFRMHVFRAAFRNDRNGPLAKPLSEAGQSACYQHASSEAETVCDHCGRYMCGLCDVTNFGGHLCSVCIDKMAADPENHRFRLSYPRYDRLVLLLALLPILVWPLTFFTAPVALALGIFGWNRAYNPVKRYRSSLVLGMIFALLELIVGAAVIISAIRSAF